MDEHIRKHIEDEEMSKLSIRATLSTVSKGRKTQESPCPIRTCFMRDRDRIVHSKAFRRLKHKTQVFLAPEGDHYRTRLTHTLEVSQISRTIARALSLNEDLTEAVALGHDLGHTAFGHIGEKALSEAVYEASGGRLAFKHNEQSIRVVEFLERDGKGLNLTEEVINGIKCHTGDELPETQEAMIVRTADRIAYVNHDTDDAVRAGIICLEDIPEPVLEGLGRSNSQRIDTLVRDVIEASTENGLVSQSKEIEELMNTLRSFLFMNVYENSPARTEANKAKTVIKGLFQNYIEQPEFSGEENESDAGLECRIKRVCDYVAGMTDRFAVKEYVKLYIPRGWQLSQIPQEES